MPDISRQSLRMDCNGIDLTHPIDRQPQNSFPYLNNVRVLQEGIIEGRPGYTQLITMLDPPNSIRRLNDESFYYGPAGYSYFGGGGSYLYAGQEATYAQILGGFSGNPLSLIPFRPDQSPESWMYVYDSLQQVKVRPDGIIRKIGVVPPRIAPVINYGTPASVTVTDGNGSGTATGWTNTGTATGTATYADRTNGESVTIGSIFYDAAGDTGWCHIQPTAASLATFWMGNRMKVILNAGGANAETVIVREVHQTIASTTISAIQYDSGTTGYCSIVLVSDDPNLERNSVIVVDTGGLSESVRVLEVINSPDGQSYSIRCFCQFTHAVGAAIQGALSWYTYTNNTHVSTETITSQYIGSVTVPSGTGGVALLDNLDLSKANGRNVSTADDYLHISVFMQNPQDVSQINLYLDIDPDTTSLSNAFTGNYWLYQINGSALTQDGPFGQGDTWTELLVALSSGTRYGTNQTLTLAGVKAIKVELVVTASTSFGFDDWYIFGTYGPVIQPNSPVGYQYASRFRDSSTGAISVPGPVNRISLFPLRESVTVTPATSTQDGVDSIDIYRLGGTLSSPLYVGSVVNNSSSPNSLTDSLPDSSVLETNQAPDLTAVQPWSVLRPPIIATAKVVGTSVIITTGGVTLPLTLLNATVILINGIAFQTYGAPVTSTYLEITQDAGYIASASIEIASPTVAGQALPYAFGPLEGPFAPVIFGLGDIFNPGVLYFTNLGSADTASDANTIELSTPSSDLVSGDTWNGLAFAGTRDTIFCIRYSYLTTIGASNNTTFQFYKVPSPSGMWSTWSCCTCPLGVAFLGRDGIYIATDTQSVNITDERLYPLFPHDGQPASPVVVGPHTLYPVDMTQLTKLRLSYCDQALRFCYVDTNGSYQTLIFEIVKRRWFFNTYANEIAYHYLVEEGSDGPNKQLILMLSVDSKSIMQAGGNLDNSLPVTSTLFLPCFDMADERSLKLFTDTVTQADGVGTLNITPWYNNGETPAPTTITAGLSGPVVQIIRNLCQLGELKLYRNMSVEYSWTGGPAGPRIWAFEYTAYMQPYLSTRVNMQFSPLSFPGWKHMRRAYPAYISQAPVYLTVACQDGRTYGPYTLPNTNSVYRIIPQMLDHGIKDLAFSFQLDGVCVPFVLFPNDFTIEMKEWTEETYIKLAVFKA